MLVYLLDASSECQELAARELTRVLCVICSSAVVGACLHPVEADAVATGTRVVGTASGAVLVLVSVG